MAVGVRYLFKFVKLLYKFEIINLYHSACLLRVARQRTKRESVSWPSKFSHPVGHLVMAASKLRRRLVDSGGGQWPGCPLGGGWARLVW
jgi:hypothetical protein